MREEYDYRITKNNHVLVEFHNSYRNNEFITGKITFYKGRYIEEENLFIYTSQKVISATIQDLEKETVAVILGDTRALGKKVRVFMKHKVIELPMSSDFKTYINVNKNKGDKDYEKLI